MTVMTSAVGTGRPVEDTPLPLKPAQTRADKVFLGTLLVASVIVLLAIVAILYFLTESSVPAVRYAGLHLLTSQHWAPTGTHQQFGLLGVLVGTVMIAAIALIVGVPVSLSAALLINEYAPRRAKRLMTAAVDLLAVLPSLLYGLWGLKVLGQQIYGFTKWLSVHASFVPLFREPDATFGNSIFICGVVVGIMIIPIVTSVSREVMSQAPRDACEAAMALGGTKWGMVTDVILPFARNGILGGVLLGLGRALGETVAVLLILSQTNVIHLNILGPGGGQIPALIANNFESVNAFGKERSHSFRAAPLHHDPRHQLHRSGRRRPTPDRDAMTMLATRSADTPMSAGTIGAGTGSVDRPRRRRHWTPGAGWEFLGALVAGGCVVLVAFQFASSRPLDGMIACWFIGFAAIYGVLTRLLHGVRIAKDRLATVFITIGAAIALFPLIEIIVSVIVQGAPVVFSHFPAFLVHDMSTAAPSDPVWKGGMGHAIVGTFEQVGLATAFTIPISMLTATFLSETASAFSRLVRTTVDSMMGTPSIIAGIFVYLFWVQPKGSGGFSGFAASIALAILMLPIMIRTAEEVLRVVPGSLREAALALGAPRWRVSLRVVLPTARSGLLTAVILGVALAVGETAPALFTAHGSPRVQLQSLQRPASQPPPAVVPDDLESECQSGARRVGRGVHPGHDRARPFRGGSPSRFIETRSAPPVVTATNPQGGRSLLTSSRTHSPRRVRGLVGLGIVGLSLLATVPAWADAPQAGTVAESVTATTAPTAAPSTTVPLLPTSGAVAVPTETPPSSVASPAPPTVPTPHIGTTIIGSGSSFAGPEVSQWSADTAKSPYNLTVDYTSTNSGDGRFNFGNNTVDFAVSDIPYQSTAFDTKQPTFTFIYVPVTAGGLAFMYNLPGLAKTVQLSSYSACAIMTGGVKMWNDPVIAADNPGLSLPAIAIHPVIRSDLAGTNFVLQEYCIREEPALWKAFVTSPVVVNNPSQVGDLSATDPRSDWPIFPTGIEASGSTAAANDVAVPNDTGYITAVETAYAIQRHFPTASVKNASGVYTQPSPVNVASALAYATQNSNGTHNLNFGGKGPHVYNPSTYSYLLSPTTGWSAAKGSVMSQFANYALTIGQQKATEIGYASLGLSLEQYGVNAMKQQVPGAVALTAQEQGSYACGDLTVPEVQAGQTQPTCGVLNTNSSSNPNQAANGGTSRTTTTTKATTSSRSRTGTGSGGSGSSGAAVDPGVSLGTGSALPVTGGAPLLIVLTGATFATIGWLVRRRLRTRMQ